MKTLHDIRVRAANPRVAGRTRLERALTDIGRYLKDITPVIDIPDDAESKFAFFREWVSTIDDSAIADDAEAGRVLQNIAYAIAHAFELGREAGRGPPERDLHKRRKSSQKGALNSRKYATNEREKWRAVALRIIDADGGRTGDEKIADKISDELAKLRLVRARRTIFNEVRALRKSTR